jgi:hypothetical protein
LKRQTRAPAHPPPTKRAADAILRSPSLPKRAAGASLRSLSVPRLAVLGAVVRRGVQSRPCKRGGAKTTRRSRSESRAARPTGADSIFPSPVSNGGGGRVREAGGGPGFSPPPVLRGRWPSLRGRRGSWSGRLVTNRRKRPSTGPPPAVEDSRHLPRRGGGGKGKGRRGSPSSPPPVLRGRWPSLRGRRGSFVRRLVTNQNNRPSVGPPPAALDSSHLPRQGGGAEGFCVTSHSRTEGAMVAALKSHDRTACGSCGDVPPNPRPGPVFARAKPTHARDVKIKTRGEATDARDETSKPRGEVVKPGGEKTNARANRVSTRGEKINARGIVFSPRAITASPRAIIVSTRGITASPRAIVASARPDHTPARISATATPARTPHDRPLFDADRGMIAQARLTRIQTTQFRAPPTRNRSRLPGLKP